MCVCVCVCQDLAQSVNEVKRDNDIIRQITTFQLSIDNMVSSQTNNQNIRELTFIKPSYVYIIYIYIHIYIYNSLSSSDAVSSAVRSA